MPHYLIGLSDKLIIPNATPISYIASKIDKKLAHYLKEFGYMKITEQKDNLIKFSGSPFRFIWNGWNLFNPVSNGAFHISYARSFIIIEYEIFFWEFLFYSILFSIPAITIPYLNPLLRIIYLIVVWSIYFFHTFWSKIRLKKLIYRIITVINEEYIDEVKISEGWG